MRSFILALIIAVLAVLCIAAPAPSPNSSPALPDLIKRVTSVEHQVGDTVESKARSLEINPSIPLILGALEAATGIYIGALETLVPSSFTYDRVSDIVSAITCGINTTVSQLDALNSLPAITLPTSPLDGPGGVSKSQLTANVVNYVNRIHAARECVLTNPGFDEATLYPVLARLDVPIANLEAVLVPLLDSNLPSLLAEL